MKKSFLRLAVPALTLSLLALAPVSSFAHAHMKSSEPKKDAVLEALPAEVRLSFSEKLEPAMSTIEVKNEDANEVVSERKLSEKSGGEVLIAELRKPTNAGAGRYTVKWKAVSKDSHKMNGQFEFTVRPTK
jgi:methionine-rich copper-binding protein CopC